MRRTAGVLGTVVTVILLAVIVGSVGLAIAQRRSHDGTSHLFGRVVLTVLSGSMTPKIDTGDLIVDRSVTAAQANNMKVGQIVTYEVPHKTYNGGPFLITHRIVGMLTIKSGKQVQHLYVTKGDANNAVDPGTVSAQQILGAYAWRIPYGGYVVSFVHTKWGFGIFVVLPILYLVGGEFVRLWKKLDQEERAAAAALPPSTAEQAR